MTEAQSTGSRVLGYPLVEALISRRSRRFAKGMSMNGGPLAYESAKAPEPLSLEEEAALAFAGCGVTGPTLAELPYESGGKKEAGAAIAATIAYCEYVYNRYGRFPANSGPPLRTVLVHQAHRLDEDFYERFYKPEALPTTQGPE
jgi:hypothetical protein